MVRIGRRQTGLFGRRAYSRRDERLRLFLLVIAFMTVCVLIERARDPRYYAWLFAVGATDRAATEAGGNARQSATNSPPPADFPDLPRLATPPPHDSPSELARLDVAERQLWKDAWQYVAETLAAADADLWGDLLLALRNQSDLDPSWAISVPTLLDDISRSLEHYVEHARQTLRIEDLQERSAWLKRLERLQTDWQQSLRPWIEEQFVQRQPAVDSAVKSSLDLIQESLDARLLAEVRDVAFFSNAESACWFRLWEKRSQGKQTESRPVLIDELMRQPKEFRGRLVRLSGEVRRVQHAQAPVNPLGIQSYYVVWARCTGSPQPLCVYVAGPVTGLPEVPLGSWSQELRVAASLEGVFFKLVSYRSQRGLDVAPVLIAGRIEPQVEQPSPADSMLQPGWLVLVSAVVGVGVAMVIWRLTSRRATHRDTRREREDR
ncbi:MAG: hypothetical protein KatS3mg110_3177 [Pirellulaceae bacterium]|nr:MAG: hypothetical protein KatS3mg110_3177 [Pirellulaceae bacterium]